MVGGEPHVTVALLDRIGELLAQLRESLSPADFDTQQRQAAEESIARLATESGLDSSRLSTVVRQGGIYHEVLEEAELMDADLIVMVSHRPALKTYFLGSNAGHVVRYATCSVLVVRTPA